MHSGRVIRVIFSVMAWRHEIHSEPLGCVDQLIHKNLGLHLSENVVEGCMRTIAVGNISVRIVVF